MTNALRAANVTAWSITRFLIEEHREGYAELGGALEGQLDDRGYPSGKDLSSLQRRVLREEWDWNPIDLERAWLAWVTGEEEK
jgi:hypothetical protein